MADPNNAQVRQQPQPQPQPSAPQQQTQPQHANPSYPSPHSHSYPSPSMQPTYSYPPSQGPPNPDQYRASPTNPSVPVGSLNLPPIRAIDGQPQPQPQAHQQPGPPAMGSPLPPPVAPMSAYYPPTAQHLPPPGQSMPLPYARMPLQGGDQRMMSGGRHKKEIKRRTKTGCLTCRKRRIKCDETHPTCRNCQKSKRDCLGYDPIFKQQPGPAALQPAPPAPSATPPATVPPPSTTAPAGPAPYSHIPQGYAPAVSAGYPSPAPATSNDPSPQFAAIDPSLSTAENPVVPIPSATYDAVATPRQEVKPPMGSASPYPAVPAFQVRRNHIEDLFSYAGVMPPTTPPDVAVNFEEIKRLYVNDYAPGLDKLLETTWYSTKGLDHLLKDAALCQTFELLRQKFLLASGPNQYEAARQIPSLEAKVTWQLLCLARTTQTTPLTNGANGTTADMQGPDQHQLSEVKARLDVLEHLLTGQPLERNPLLTLNYGHVPESDPKRFQIDFWKYLGAYVSGPHVSEPSKPSVEAALAGMRSILHQLENRDVIYSIAIVRHIGAKPEIASILPAQPWTHDAEDEYNKLFVAKRFLEDESQNGMTQVIARFAGMSVTGWSPPAR